MVVEKAVRWAMLACWSVVVSDIKTVYSIASVQSMPANENLFSLGFCLCAVCKTSQCMLIPVVLDCAQEEDPLPNVQNRLNELRLLQNFQR